MRVLSPVTDWKEILDNNLDEEVPKPKPRAMLKSYMEPGYTAKATNGDSQFCGSVREPSETETKKMIALLIAIGVVSDEQSLSNYRRFH